MFAIPTVLATVLKEGRTDVPDERLMPISLHNIWQDGEFIRPAIGKRRRRWRAREDTRRFRVAAARHEVSFDYFLPWPFVGLELAG